MIQQMAFTPDSRWLVTRQGGELQMWKPESGEKGSVIRSPNTSDQINWFGFGSGGRWLATLTSQPGEDTRKTLRMWDMGMGRVTHEMDAGRVTRIGTDHDKWLAIAHEDNNQTGIRLFRVILPSSK
jgi:WD40 repeat protein